MLVACLIVLLAASAHTQGNAMLSFALEVTSSISLVFQNNPSVGNAGFCPLVNAGTNDVGLDLGTATFQNGDSLPCVLFTHTGGGTYQVSSAFDVVVRKSNSSSASYTLSASISSTPPNGVIWMLNSITLGTSYTTLDSADSYDQAVTKTLTVQVKNANPAAAYREAIYFVATAN